MEESERQDQSMKAGENYQRTKMQEEMIFRKLKDMGCRVTKQRRILLNVILQEECASCKEIYYKARKEDPRIGAATVYRMINLLEEIGAISRNNMYTISGAARAGSGCSECPETEEEAVCMGQRKKIACVVELDDHTSCCLSAKECCRVMTKGLKACGYIQCQRVTNILLPSCLETKKRVKTGAAGSVIERISQQGKSDGK